MPKLRNNPEGQIHHGRKVVSFSHYNKAERPLWNVRCLICGHEVATNYQALTRNGCRTCAVRKRPFESLYNCFLIRAHYPVGITFEQFLEFTKVHECHYCSTPIEWYEYRKKDYNGHSRDAYNLDRRDNSLGYTMNNVVVCCKRCNKGKGDGFTYDEWMQIGALIKTWKEDNAKT